MGFFKMLRLFGIGQQMFKSERFSAANNLKPPSRELL